MQVDQDLQLVAGGLSSASKPSATTSSRPMRFVAIFSAGKMPAPIMEATRGHVRVE